MAGGRWVGTVTAVLAVGMVAGAFVGARALQQAALEPPAIGPDDGRRAQQKIFAIIRPSRSTEPGRVVLTEGELNSFLERHLADVAGLLFTGAIVRFPRASTIEFAVRLPVVDLAGGAAVLAGINSMLPVRWQRHTVWIHVRARAGVENGPAGGRRRYLNLEVDRFALGRQPLPPSFLPRLLGPSALRLLRWQLPASVDTVIVEPGHAVITVVGSPSRSGAGDHR